MRDLNSADQAAAQQQQLNAQGQISQMGLDQGLYNQQGAWQMNQNNFNQDMWNQENMYGQAAWNMGNQYANNDYWAGVNEWGVPMDMMGQISGAMSSGDPSQSPWGNAFSPNTPQPWWANQGQSPMMNPNANQSFSSSEVR